MKLTQITKNMVAARPDVFVTLVGLAVNIALTVIKYISGIAGRSGAMIADATHSLSDLLTDFAVLLGLRYTSKPADREHAYGHGRIDTLVAAFCGIILLMVGLGIFFDGSADVFSVLRGEDLPVPGGIALFAALLSIASKELLFRYTSAVGQELNSASLKANAWHHRSDSLSSIGSLIGVGGSILGGGGWGILDPIAAVVVSIFIVHAAVSIFWNSIREVLDTSLAPAQVEAIEKAALEFPEIVDIHKIRTRRIGFYAAVEAHIVLDGLMVLQKAHDIATALEDKLKTLLGQHAIITLHTEPCDQVRQRRYN